MSVLGSMLSSNWFVLSVHLSGWVGLKPMSKSVAIVAPMGPVTLDHLLADWVRLRWSLFQILLRDG